MRVLTALDAKTCGLSGLSNNIWSSPNCYWTLCFNHHKMENHVSKTLYWTGGYEKLDILPSCCHHVAIMLPSLYHDFLFLFPRFYHDFTMFLPWLDQVFWHFWVFQVFRSAPDPSRWVPTGRTAATSPWCRRGASPSCLGHFGRGDRSVMILYWW